MRNTEGKINIFEKKRLIWQDISPKKYKTKSCFVSVIYVLYELKTIHNEFLLDFVVDYNATSNLLWECSRNRAKIVVAISMVFSYHIMQFCSKLVISSLFYFVNSLLIQAQKSLTFNGLNGTIDKCSSTTDQV